MFGQTVKRASQCLNNGLNADESGCSFGGVDRLLLFGDMLQLPPVLDTGLYSPAGGNEPALVGRNAYRRLITNAVVLEQPVRQSAPGQEQYLRELTAMRDGTAGTPASLRFWNSRAIGNLAPSERKRILNSEKTVFLFPTNEQVDEKNERGIHEDLFSTCCIWTACRRHPRKGQSNWERITNPTRLCWSCRLQGETHHQSVHPVGRRCWSL